MAAAALSIPLARITSSKGTMAMKEHQRAKQRGSTGPLSSSPPNMPSLLSATSARFEFMPTTLSSGAASHGTRAIPTAFSSSSVEQALPSISPTSTTSSSTSSTSSTKSRASSKLERHERDSFDAFNPSNMDTFSVASTNQDSPLASQEAPQKERWIKRIIPDKLIHFDPSKDPKLFAL